MDTANAVPVIDDDQDETPQRKTPEALVRKASGAGAVTWTKATQSDLVDAAAEDLIFIEDNRSILELISEHCRRQFGFDVLVRTNFNAYGSPERGVTCDEIPLVEALPSYLAYIPVNPDFKQKVADMGISAMSGGQSSLLGSSALETDKPMSDANAKALATLIVNDIPRGSDRVTLYPSMTILGRYQDSSVNRCKLELALGALGWVSERDFEYMTIDGSRRSACVLVRNPHSAEESRPKLIEAIRMLEARQTLKVRQKKKVSVRRGINSHLLRAVAEQMRALMQSTGVALDERWYKYGSAYEAAEAFLKILHVFEAMFGRGTYRYLPAFQTLLRIYREFRRDSLCWAAYYGSRYGLRTSPLRVIRFLESQGKMPPAWKILPKNKQRYGMLRVGFWKYCPPVMRALRQCSRLPQVDDPEKVFPGCQRNVDGWGNRYAPRTDVEAHLKKLGCFRRLKKEEQEKVLNSWVVLDVQDKPDPRSLPTREEMEEMGTP